MDSKLVLFLVATLTVVAVGASHSEEDFKDKEYSTIVGADPGKVAPIPAPSTPSTPAVAIKPPSSSSPPAAPSPPVVPAPVMPTPPTGPAPVSPPTAASPPFPPVRTLSDCTPLCGGRCKLHSRPNVCLRACKACCFRCKCVPPGTYGNREKCGKCYTQMTTRYNKPKCP